MIFKWAANFKISAEYLIKAYFPERYLRSLLLTDMQRNNHGKGLVDNAKLG